MIKFLSKILRKCEPKPHTLDQIIMVEWTDIEKCVGGCSWFCLVFVALLSFPIIDDDFVSFLQFISGFVWLVLGSHVIDGRAGGALFS